tara:strand:+ start:582 stop:1064 length:483 start_codon:yes stop_codon:yes gene_type:complete
MTNNTRSLNKFLDINIVYYDNNEYQNTGKKNKAIVYNMKIDKNYKAFELIKIFHKFLIYQHNSIRRCFGEDIGNIIVQYMPIPIKLENIDNLYFYIHRLTSLLDLKKNQLKFKRHAVLNEAKLIDLHNSLIEKKDATLNLRLRRLPLNQTGNNFKKTFNY